MATAGAAERAAAELARIDIQERDRLFKLPAIDQPLLAQLGGKIRFLGYSLDQGQIKAGETLSLTLYWQGMAACDVSYSVFTHLLDEKSRLFGQSDGLPAGGALPTTHWAPQEIVVDQHRIPVSAGAIPGEYHVEVGMYHSASGQRLPVQDESGVTLGDHLLLESSVFVMR